MVRAKLRKHHTPHARIGITAGAGAALIGIYAYQVGFRAPVTVGETLLLAVIAGLIAGMIIGWHRRPRLPD